MTVPRDRFAPDVVHDPTYDDWSDFQEIIMTQDGAQSFVPSIVNREGRLTPTTADGNHRVAHLLHDTFSRDAEMTSLILQPLADNNNGSTFPQQGHIHRVRQISPGLYEGIAIWTAVFGGDYNVLNYRGVRWGHGVTLPQSGGDAASGSDAGHVDNAGLVLSWTTSDPFDLGAVHIAQAERAAAYSPGDTITVTDVNAAVDGARVVLDSNVNQGQITWTDAVVGTNALTVSGTGTVAHTGISHSKRYTPFWFSTRVVGGTPGEVFVEYKRWRPYEGEPTWADKRVRRRQILPDADVPTLATEPGFCARWNAHARSDNGNVIRWGPSYWTNLDDQA